MTVNFELNNKPQKDGRTKILVRLTHNRKLKRLSLSKAVLKSDFDKGARHGKWVKSTNPHSESINKYLKLVYNKFDSIISDLSLSDNPLNLKTVIDRFNGQENDCIIDYFRSLSNGYRSRGQARYFFKSQTVLNKLVNFNHGSPLRFEDFDFAYFRRFENYLYEIGNCKNTVHTNLKVITNFYRQAIRANKIIKPSLGILEHKLGLEPVEKNKLDQYEISRIEELTNTLPKSILLVKDYFLFSFYAAGMRFGDLVLLQWKNISNDNKFLTYRMSKNKKLVQFKLPIKASFILDKYERGKPNHLVFPILQLCHLELNPIKLAKAISSKNALINKDLKILASYAGIDKKLSMHISRHSFGYIGFKATKDLVAMQRLLRHSNLRETQSYITSLSNDKDQDLLGEIFNEEKND